jgi:hypothetical protein
MVYFTIETTCFGLYWPSSGWSLQSMIWMEYHVETFLKLPQYHSTKIKNRNPAAFPTCCSITRFYKLLKWPQRTKYGAFVTCGLKSLYHILYVSMMNVKFCVTFWVLCKKYLQSFVLCLIYIFLLYLYESVYILLSLVLDFLSMECIMYCIVLILHGMALSSGYL